MLTPGFVAPAMLGLLAFAALVIWLHTTRPERRVVPSLQIWLTLQDMPGAARRRWRLPKLSALLLLQLAALVALVLALAQPFLGAPPPTHLVIVLDGSAPMNTPTEQGRLFDQAITDLTKTLTEQKGAPPERVSVLLAGPMPRLLAARHAYEPQMLRPMLAGLNPSDGPIDWLATQELVRQTLDPAEEATSLVVGATEPPATFRDMPGLGTVERLAITPPSLAPSLDVSHSQDDAQKWVLLGAARGDLSLKNATLEIGFTPLADIGVRPPLPWKTIKLNFTEGKATVSDTLDLKDPGLLTLHALADDRAEWPGSTAYFLTQAASPQRVLYVAPATAPDQPLVKGLLAQQDVEVFRTDGLPADHADYALVIVDGISLPAAPAAPTLWIGNAGIGETAATAVRVADADFWHPFHPLTRVEDWRTPNFGVVSTRPLPGESEVLLSGASYPLLAVSTRDGFHDLHMTFDPRQVQWGSGDVLPVLAGSITDWLGITGAPRINCQVGAACAGAAGTFQALEGGESFSTQTAVFTPDEAGVYRTPTGGFLAINAAPDRFSASNTDDDSAVAQDPSAPHALLLYLLIAALLLLAADAALRLRVSGKRALPALVALVFVGAAIVGVAFPLPFERSVRVAIVPEGSLPTDNHLAVAAGAAPAILGTPQTTPAQDDTSVPASIATTITHPAGALALATALIPSHQIVEIVPAATIRAPISRGSSDRLTLSSNAVLDQVSATPEPAVAPILTALAIPADAAPGDRLGLTVLVQSSVEMPVQIGFHANGTQLAVEDVTLQNGMNRIETELPPLALGETLFTVALNTDSGHKSTLSALVTARAGRPILVLSSDPAHGEAFAQLATADVPGIPTDARAAVVISDPAAAPDYLRNWLGYDAIVLLNMPARAVTSREANLIETAVTSHGLGLVMLGGGNAFGPGGYFATPFEKLSPLSARVPREAPEVTMVFVLDRSGSMNQTVGGGTRLEMARQATQGAISLLNPESQVGIVVFDTEARTVLPLTRAGDADAVRAALATVDTGGGTAIAPGLEAGWTLLRGSQAQARHMIVMTDGLSLPGDFGGIAGRMRNDGITVSAVAVGTGSDAKAVMEIAAAGGGSVHASDDFSTLPSILSQEAMLLSSPVREGAGQPRFADASDPLLRGLPNRLPPIDGVVLTTAKPDAQVALTTTTPDGEEAPLLATWRHGNGHVLAFASDVTGDWTRNWQADPALASLWPHVLRQIRPVRPATGPWLRLVDAGETMQLTLEVLNADGGPHPGLSPTAEIIIDSNPSTSLQMAETKPGIYEATFSPTQTGRIAARVALPAEPSPAATSATAPDVVAETAYFRSRPLWAEPIASAPLRVTGGAATLPSGWGVRLVPGLTTPWLAIALVAFLAALIFYMRPPRRASRRAGDNAQTRSVEGMTT